MDYPEWDITSSAILDNVSFQMFTKEEILKLSVKEITVPDSFDLLLCPIPGGVYDPALGSTGNENCRTCGQNRHLCTGHFGHIQLPLTCFNPVTFMALWKIIRISCFSCYKLAIPTKNIQILESKLSLLDSGQLVTSKIVDDFKSNVTDLMQWYESLPPVKKNRGNINHERHLIAARAEVVSDFLKNSTLKNCPHCRKPMRKFKCVLQDKIFSAEIVHKKADQKEAVKKNSRRKSKDVPATKVTYRKTYITPVEAKQIMRKIWENNGHVLHYVFGCLNRDMLYPTDMFFLDVLPVIPNCFRPPLVLMGSKFESAQTSNYASILHGCNMVREAIKILSYHQKQELSALEDSFENLTDEDKAVHGSTLEQFKAKKLEKLQTSVQEAWVQLQQFVNSIYDAKLNASKTKFLGIKQILEKKEGLFRKHMMGKRVNFAARSVITPDPNISVSEIGVPKVFAMTLTYPQPVTPWNVHELRQMVINGPDVYPGAHSVVDQYGVKRRLYADNRTQRESIANQLLTPATSNKGIITGKKVNRHLIPGDYLLVNRQPTLHKPSMQAHRARIIPNIKTFRLHYANCKAYNADFDGDEMTAHFPQSEIGRAEAMEISNSHNQYLVPKDGTPLAGLIQDHIVSGVRLTLRGRFFNRHEYQQLVFGALLDQMENIQTLKPAIIKPRKFWSGKQVVSTLLLNIIPSNKPPLTIDSTSKIAEKLWSTDVNEMCLLSEEMSADMGESHVIIKDSELLCGVLDKGQYGATSYGLVHCCYELYGGKISTQLLTCLGRLFTNFLQMTGFTLGIKDILMLDCADKKRQKHIKKIKEFSEADVRSVLKMNSNKEDESIEKTIRNVIFSKDDRPLSELNHKIKNITNDVQNDILKATMPNGLLCKFPDNNLQLMVNAGAKGTSVNAMQMSCLLGQIELEGRRPPMMFSGRFLPSFTRFDISPQAGGFVMGRFLTGISPQEYFVHCMAGREGLIDTAVKTSRSGYLQRCLIKHLEGVMVGYDLTVRDSDNTVIQFYYGEDGLDVMKTKLLEPERFPVLIQNRAAVVNSETSLPKMNEDAKETQDQIFDLNSRCLSKESLKYNLHATPFLKFCKKKEDSLDLEAKTKLIPGRTSKAAQLCQMWYNLSSRKKEKYRKKIKHFPDPVLSKMFPYQDKYAVSEHLYKTMKNYSVNLESQLNQKHRSKNEKITADQFTDLISCKFLQSLVQPGESVGVLSSQSIGEPSTQMTLNTFHFAGYGEMNVTLGIPRLREILMTSLGNMKTPMMTIPVLPSISYEKAEQFQKQLTNVTLDMVLEKVEITEKISMQDRMHHRLYIVKFQFLPPSVYENKLPTDPANILRHMEKEYLPSLVTQLKSDVNQTQDTVLKLPGKLLRTSSAHMVNGAGSKDDDTEEGEREETGADNANMDDSNTSKDKVTASNDDDDDDDYDELSDEESGVKSRKHQDEQDYDDDEDDNNNNDDDDDDGITSQESNSENEDDDKDEEEEEEDISEARTPAVKSSSVKASKRRKTLKSFDNAIHEYIFDEAEQLWCEITFKLNVKLTKIDLMTLVKSSVTKSSIHNVPGISRSLLTEVKTPGGMELNMQIEGINFNLILQHGNILDLSRLYCNNHHIMAIWFGIEAGLKVLIKEIQAVFAVYGIKVDYRHLSLIADYMTFGGKIQAFDRGHMMSCSSPFQQISFESACHFLSQATLGGLSDHLKSPSACLVTGKHVKSGTGFFDLCVPLKS